MGPVTRTADLWHHYGRTRHATDRAVSGGFHWNWGQDSGPGAELLGDVTGQCVGDLGAVDFTEPRELLPAAATALRPGGRLVFSTLAHHLGGAPAHPDIQHTEIGAKTPNSVAALMHRWVLQEHAWTKLLDEAGFTRISTQVLPGGPGPRAADTLLVTAFRTGDQRYPSA
ncbi:hypothetical protein [Streptomyces sp. NPDC050535]|uniref:hypothetical protein n=1 Tax=Streptomyces sp. NPDC050535 TaxID=3365626 RepID=UPI0037A9AC5E